MQDPEASAAPGPAGEARPPSIWWTPRAVGLHVTLLLLVPLFVGLFWWQVQRVREGNTLSWAYVFEWPFFTGYAAYLWWKLVHEQPGLETSGPTAASTAGGGGKPADAAREAEDEALAAYNRYLAALHESGRPKRR